MYAKSLTDTIREINTNNLNTIQYFEDIENENIELNIEYTEKLYTKTKELYWEGTRALCKIDIPGVIDSPDSTEQDKKDIYEIRNKLIHVHKVCELTETTLEWLIECSGVVNCPLAVFSFLIKKNKINTIPGIIC